jgi:transposase-like protein
MKDDLLKKCPLCGNENLIVTNGIVSCTDCSFKKAERNGKTFVKDG